MLCLFCVRENTRRRKHTQVQFCGCFGWFKARNRLQKCLEKFSLAFFCRSRKAEQIRLQNTPYIRTVNIFSHGKTFSQVEKDSQAASACKIKIGRAHV